VTFRTVLIVALALVCGGSAAIGINKYRDQDAPTGKVETVPVVVAKVDIPRGESITAGQIEVEQYLKAPPGAASKIEDVVDRSVYTSLYKGDAIMEKKLAPKGAGRGMGALIPKGMRAISIQTPTVASAGAGFIVPHSRVDVLMTPNGSNNDGLTGTSTVILQNVEVFAVGNRVEAPAENKVDAKELHEVTLLVTPDQATGLALVQTKGTLHLSLRNSDDTSVVAPRLDKTLIETVLGPKDAGGDMAAKIPRGMRAISIDTPSVASAGGGLIQVGSRVDVWMAGSAAVVLQNVEVLAVGPRVETPTENKVDTKEKRVKEVTLLVNPAQAGTLALVQSKGAFHLTLRNSKDLSVLLQREEPEPIKIRTVRGAQESFIDVLTRPGPGSR